MTQPTYLKKTKEYVEEGYDVYWFGLCRFSWKKRAKTKKEATKWTEFPYMAEGPKLRFVPEDNLDIDAKGEVLKIKKGPNYGKEESK